jgi:hypothetical protein
MNPTGAAAFGESLVDAHERSPVRPFTAPDQRGSQLHGDVRLLSFNDVDVIAASPTLAWDRGGRWRLDTR